MRRRLWWHATAFVACAVAGVLWAASSIGFRASDLAPLGDLSRGAWALLALMALGLYAADLLRYRVFGWALGEKVSTRAAFDASVACNFFSMLTPGGSMGAPGAALMLRRHGMPMARAALLAVLKSLAGTLGLLILALFVVWLGFGPRLDPAAMSWLTVAAALLGVCVGALVLGAALKQRSLAWLERLELRHSRFRLARMTFAASRSTLERLGYLRASQLPAIAAVNALFFCNYVGMLVLIASGLGARPLAETAGIGTTYLAFVYVAPTPGASGLAEAAGPGFFSGVLPPTHALAAVLAFRALTAWFQIAAGALHLIALGVGRDGLDERR